MILLDLLAMEPDALLKAAFPAVRRESRRQPTSTRTMNHGHLYFEVHADEPDRARAFYGKVFGWSFRKMDLVPIDYWSIETGGSRGGLLKRPADTPPPQCGVNAWVCSVEVEDFDTVADAILSEGGQVALPKFAVPGMCWQGYFLDPEGNTFGLFQVDENAR